MRIVSIRIENYKNIGPTSIDLNGIVALLSVNNYGKSNLLEAIQFGMDFINASTKKRVAMMKLKRDVPLNPALAGKPFSFRVEIDAPELEDYRHIRYGYTFEWINDAGTGARIVDETLEMRSEESAKYTAYLKRSEGKYRSSRSTRSFRSLALSDTSLALDFLIGVEKLDIAPVIHTLRNMKYNICDDLQLDYAFHPFPIEFDFEKTPDRLIDDSDLPRALFNLKQQFPEDYELFLDAVYELFPDFQNVEIQALSVEPPEGMSIVAKSGAQVTPEEVPYHIREEIYKLFIQTTTLNQPISIEYMSTGTKRILWLLANAVFCKCYGYNLLCVDEIETSIHPRMIRQLLTIINELLSDATVLLTSHSPLLSQYLKPQAMYIGLPSDTGVATFKKINPRKINLLVKTARTMNLSVGEYLFELMSGDEDSYTILATFLEADA